MEETKWTPVRNSVNEPEQSKVYMGRNMKYMRQVIQE